MATNSQSPTAPVEPEPEIEAAVSLPAEDERDYDDDDELDIEPPPRTEVSRFVKPRRRARAPTPRCARWPRYAHTARR